MVKLNSKKGKEIVAEIKQALLNGDIGDIFAPDFDQSEVDWVDFRCSNEKWEAGTTQKQFREAAQRIIKKLLDDNTAAAEEAADIGVNPRRTGRSRKSFLFFRCFGRRVLFNRSNHLFSLQLQLLAPLLTPQMVSEI